MAINLDSVFDLEQAYSLWFYKLAHVDHIMTQTNHAHTPLLFILSPRYKLSNIATSALTSKEIIIFEH